VVLMSDSLYLSDGRVVHNHNFFSEPGDALFDRLRAVFPVTLKDAYQAIADEYVHEVLGHPVIRTCLLVQDAKDMIGKEVATCHRLFDLEAKTSILYTTDFFDQAAPAYLSPNSYVLAKTEHFEEYGRPASSQLLGFCEYFFIAPLNELNSFYGLQLGEIPTSTVFSALVKDGEIVSVRRYTNDADTLLNGWQTAYMYFSKKARRIDLMRQLLNLEFIADYT
jgi:hypothetical protein